MPGQRLDKWLWCARLVKTRSGAARLIEAGKVRINGTRALKPSRLVQAGGPAARNSPSRLADVRARAHAADEVSRRKGSALGSIRPARSNSVALSTGTGRPK